MQKNQYYKTPSHQSPAKLKQQQQLQMNNSVHTQQNNNNNNNNIANNNTVNNNTHIINNPNNQSQQRYNSVNNSIFMSKSLTFAHSSFPLKCNNQSHQNADAHSICLKEDCDKPYRLACLKCMNGHHKDHNSHMVKISDFLQNEIKEQLPFGVQNYPINPIGKEIRDYIEGEEKYVQDLYEGVESYFKDFMEKVQNEVNKIKQNMQADIANYYKKGAGKQQIDFLNQLKSHYINSYDLTDLQTSIKDLVNRGLQYDIFDTRLEYFINSHANKESREQTNNFYLKNRSKNSQGDYEDPCFQIDFSHLQDLQKDITDGIHKCRKVSNQSKKQEIPKNGKAETIPWNEVFHSILNYLSKQYQELSQKDIIQYTQEIYADNSKYEGFLVNGHRDMIGSRFYIDGNVYLGEWSKGVKSGNGLFYYFKGNIYEGGFYNDKREGYGKELYTTGAKYEGEFSNDLKHGSGKYTYPDGKVFQGTYILDKREGQGIFISPNGKIEEVMYKDGNRIQVINGVEQVMLNSQSLVVPQQNLLQSQLTEDLIKQEE